MKFAIAAFLLVAVAAIQALPIEGEYEELVVPDGVVVLEGRADRHRRVTCDLLSVGGFVGDAACAANCLSMGKAGGHCNGSGVCECRKDTIKDLWNKRFG